MVPPIDVVRGSGCNKCQVQRGAGQKDGWALMGEQGGGREAWLNGGVRVIELCCAGLAGLGLLG